MHVVLRTMEIHSTSVCSSPCLGGKQGPSKRHGSNFPRRIAKRYKVSTH